jgi:hypothetical protein
MWPVINSSVLIGWNILSSLNAVTSTNERNRIYKRSHMVYNLAYNQILQTKETLALGPHFLHWKVNLGSWITWYISEIETNLGFTFQFLNDGIYQNTNFAKLPSAKWLFWYYCKF